MLGELSFSGAELELIHCELKNIQGRLADVDYALTIGDVLASGLRWSVQGRFWLWWTRNGKYLDTAGRVHDPLRCAIAHLEEVQADLLAGIVILSARKDELYDFQNKLAHGYSTIAPDDSASVKEGFYH